MSSMMEPKLGMKNSSLLSHPIEKSTLEWPDRAREDEMKLVASSMGSHMVFRLKMEQRAVANTGHLPFMDTKSSLMTDLLDNKDEAVFDNLRSVSKEGVRVEGNRLPHDIVEAALADINL